MNGGSIVFFADGDPLFYQVNLFLENAEFPIFDEDKNLEEEEIESSSINKRNTFDYDFDSHEQSIDFKLKNVKKIFQNEEEETENKTENKKFKKEKIENKDEGSENEIKDEGSENEIKEEGSENEIKDEGNENEIKEEGSENEIKEEKDKRNEEEESEEERENESEDRISEDKISDNKIEINEKEMMRDKKLKVSFKIDGSHKGGQTLVRDDSGLLEDYKTFNASNEVISNLKRPNIGNNLLKIYEGITVSYAAENNKEVLNIFMLIKDMAIILILIIQFFLLFHLQRTRKEVFQL